MVINFFGRRGSGKTTTIRGNLKDCRPPVVIVDILGNYQDLKLGYIQTNSLPQCIQEIKKYYLKPDLNRKIINLKTSDPATAADYISAAIWEINGGTLVLDEGDSISIEQGSCFDEYIRYGRNHNGDLLFGCRRPAEMERNITAAANKFYCFQTHEWRDVEYFCSQGFGDYAEQLIHMPRFHGIFLNYDANCMGKFRIDREGLIYHIEEVSLFNHNEGEFQK